MAKPKEAIGHSLSMEVKNFKVLTSRMESQSIQDAVRLLKQLRDYRDWIKSEMETLTEDLDKARQVIIPQMFKESGLSSITVDGYRFSLSETVRASIPGETKPEAYQWLRDTNRGALIIETVNASTLAAEARRMLEDGDALPEELFKVYVQPNVSITKAASHGKEQGSSED